MLRHTLSTLAYRSEKVLRDPPAELAGFRAAPDIRTPAEILAHLGDLLDWALSLAVGNPEWHNSPPLPWTEGLARFYTALEALDRRLESHDPLGCPAEKLFQGPIADSLTHIGQIAILRRMCGCPIRGENYFVAEISTGRVGPDQANPRREFD
jgi:hypothetical protein